MATGTMDRPFPYDTVGVKVLSTSSSIEDNLSISANYRGVMFSTSNNTGRCGAWIIEADTNGLATLVEIKAASDFTFTATNGNLKIEHGRSTLRYLTFSVLGDISMVSSS